jgi:hypothetical protein
VSLLADALNGSGSIYVFPDHATAEFDDSVTKRGLG